MAMTLVSTVTVGSGGAASIEFTNIPQTGKDLLCVYSGRLDANSFIARIEFNGSSAANYSSRQLYGDGANVFSNAGTGETYFSAFSVVRSIHTASTFGNSQIYVSNYTSSVAKSVSMDNVTENNATTAYQEIYAGLWNQTAAITSLKLTANSGSFVQHSTASLYIIS